MPQLTSEQRREYLDHAGNRCPLCQSRNIEGGERNTDGRDHTEEIKCHYCGAEWTDIYRLYDVELKSSEDS